MFSKPVYDIDIIVPTVAGPKTTEFKGKNSVQNIPIYSIACVLLF